MWERFVRYATEKFPILAKQLTLYSSYAIIGPNALAIRFPTSYASARKECESEASQLRLQDAIKRITGHPVALKFELDRNATAQPVARPQGASAAPAPTERKRSLTALPLFKKASEVLGAQIWHVDDEFDPAAAPKPAAKKATDTEETDTEEG